MAQIEKLAKKRRPTESTSSESDANEDAPKLMDSDDDYREELICPGCKSDEGGIDEWITCRACSRRWHITCTGDEVVYEIPAHQIQNYPYHCEYCI